MVMHVWKGPQFGYGLGVHAVLQTENHCSLPMDITTIDLIVAFLFCKSHNPVRSNRPDGICICEGFLVLMCNWSSCQNMDTVIFFYAYLHYNHLSNSHMNIQLEAIVRKVLQFGYKPTSALTVWLGYTYMTPMHVLDLGQINLFYGIRIDQCQLYKIIIYAEGV